MMGAADALPGAPAEVLVQMHEEGKTRTSDKVRRLSVASYAGSVAHVDWRTSSECCCRDAHRVRVRTGTIVRLRA
jgi:hypothetical protein